MKQKPQLLTWILLSQSVLVVAAMFSYYYQSQIEVLTSWQISLIMLVSTGLNIGAVHLASRLGQRLSGLKLIPYWIGLVVLAYSLAVLGQVWLFPLIYLLTDALIAFFIPLFEADFQEELPSQIRATMLSLASMAYSLAMVVVFPLTGWLIDRLTFGNAFLILALVLLASLPFLRRFRLTSG